MNRFVVISGCSGGGKSTLLAELGRRGHAIVEEPGRRIVAEELRGEGLALPWVDEVAFARRALAVAAADYEAARGFEGWVFFDRGLIDAAAALQYATNEPLALIGQTQRYNRQVFLTPPWPEIYRADEERRHGFNAAVAEYQRLTSVYPSLDYEVRVLPKVGVAERAEFIMRSLEACTAPGRD